MESTTFLQTLLDLAVWPYMVLFIVISSTIKKYLGEWLSKVTKTKWKTVYTVLVIATLIGIPYAIFADVTWTQVLITYALGTSFHELILGKVVEAVTKLFGGK